MKEKLFVIFVLFIFLSSCSPTYAPSPTNTVVPTPMPTGTSLPTLTPSPRINPFVILYEPFSCGDGITDISTNASFNGLFKSNGFDQSHGHMDILPPDGCDITIDKLNSPITGNVTKYTFEEPDEGGTNWGYKIEFPYGSYPAGIEEAFRFSGINDFDISMVKRVEIDIAHVECKVGDVYVGEPFCSVVPMPEKYGETRIAMQIGIDLIDGRGFMFSPTLFKWNGHEWECDKVPIDSFCEPSPNFYKPGIK